MNQMGKGGGINIDRSVGYYQAEFPRQPSEYHLTTHFLQRMKEKRRFLTGEVIGRLITFGHMSNNKDGCARFKWSRRGGVFYYLIAGYHERGHRIVITAWPELEEREPALRSARWTEEKLDMVEQFNEEYEQRNSQKNTEIQKYRNWNETPV